MSNSFSSQLAANLDVVRQLVWRPAVECGDGGAGGTAAQVRVERDITLAPRGLTVECGDGGAGGAAAQVRVERDVTLAPPGERLAAGVAADRVVVAGEEQAGVGQLAGVRRPRRPAGPQQVGPASHRRTVDVGALRVQRHEAGVGSSERLRAAR